MNTMDTVLPTEAQRADRRAGQTGGRGEAQSAGVSAEVAKLLQLPIYFRVVPDDGKAPELIPELTRHSRSTTQYPRVSADPFLDEATCDASAAAGRQTLVVAGFATEVVVVNAV